MFALYPSARPDALTLSAYVDATRVLTLPELESSIADAIARSPTFAPTAPELVFGRFEPADSYHLHLTPEERGRDLLVHRRREMRRRRAQLVALQVGDFGGLVDLLAERFTAPAEQAPRRPDA